MDTPITSDNFKKYLIESLQNDDDGTIRFALKTNLEKTMGDDSVGGSKMKRRMSKRRNSKPRRKTISNRHHK